MNRLDELRRDASWLRDVPDMPQIAARIEWAVREIEGLRADLKEALSILGECEIYFAERAVDGIEAMLTGESGAEEMKLLCEVRPFIVRHASGPTNIGEI